jgi:hypothetical protein
MDYASLYPLMGFQARGAFSKLWIHKYTYSKSIVTKYYYPANPRTGKQQGQRVTLFDGMYNWSQFSSEVKNYYNELKKPAQAYGMQRYIQLYLNANKNMIIYWQTLELSAIDPSTIPQYIATDYFAGVGRLLAATSYPASPPYGAVRYQSALKKFLGFKEDQGWGELGGGGAGDFLVTQVFS